jgi:hypothetical protein
MILWFIIIIFECIQYSVCQIITDNQSKNYAFNEAVDNTIELASGAGSVSNVGICMQSLEDLMIQGPWPAPAKPLRECCGATIAARCDSAVVALRGVVGRPRASLPSTCEGRRHQRHLAPAMRRPHDARALRIAATLARGLSNREILIGIGPTPSWPRCAGSSAGLAHGAPAQRR